jgi:lipoprotein-anchoring transpeptidase ErfK/SrfK
MPGFIASAVRSSSTARCAARLRALAAVALFLAGAAILFSPGRALAQEAPQGLAASANGMTQAILDPGDVQDSHTPPEPPAGPALTPPLPFVGPQIGPVIKRYYGDDIDRRTTAFLPASLDFMTPITLPVTEERWVRIDLSEQVLVAYDGRKPVRAFMVSSGLPGWETVTGEFRVRMKVRSQRMTGEGYDLPNVQWVQYFYADYGLHGTYWHNDFGRPKSHGCVNMTNADAKWVWDWLGPVWDGSTVWQRSSDDNPGSLVIVHQ